MTKKTEVQTSFEDHPDQGSMMKAALAVNAISHSHSEILKLQQAILEHVKIARANRASWQAIGDALHISRSAAQKYYGDLLN